MAAGMPLPLISDEDAAICDGDYLEEGRSRLGRLACRRWPEQRVPLVQILFNTNHCLNYYFLHARNIPQVDIFSPVR
jgi:hypothetical protein